MTKMNPSPILAVAVLALALSGCNPPTKKAATEEPTGAEEPAEEQVSILRPEVEIDREPDTLEPLQQRIGFDPKGKLVSAEGEAALADVITSAQFKAGGPIILRGHSDTGGNDTVNLRASESRAKVVRDWLVKNGVDSARITLIAMGEHNPAKPNVKPDGTPDEANRAFNRRVDLTIGVAEAAKAPEKEEPQTLVERVAAEN